jgi:hypothetical protein
MTLDIMMYSGSWVTLWSEYGTTSHDLSHTIMPYIEVTDSGYNKIWLHVSPKEFEDLQVEYKTSFTATFVEVEMRVAYKTLSGEVFDNLTGTFMIKIYGIVDEDAEPHKCADVSLTKKNTVANEKMAFAKDWDFTYGDQYWSKTIQGVLDTK